VTMRPIFWLRPLRDQGMPVARETRRLAAVMPTKRFQLNPPLFMLAKIAQAGGAQARTGI